MEKRTYGYSEGTKAWELSASIQRAFFERIITLKLSASKYVR